MLLGSHQSMSYLEPNSKWDKFIHFFTKAQDVDIQTQYEKYFVRVFDIRLYVDDRLHIYFKQGNVVFKTVSIYDVLGFFNRKGDCYVRVSLAITNSDFMRNLNFVKYQRFREYCALIEEIYPNITFFGGTVVQTDELLYIFTKNKCDLKEIKMVYSSKDPFLNVLANFFRKICPRIFAETRNLSFYEAVMGDSSIKTYFLMDFVDKGN